MRSVLVANRGEVVARIARTARRLAIGTVAVASDADRDAPHTRCCDRVVPIGGASPADSYLRVDKLIDAARASGADAVHPGYGFLAESAPFARAVQDAGLTWIGPPPEAIEAMADKSHARLRLAARGVPVLPGWDGDGDPHDAVHRIGFPLMVKARAGGGGRGMRLVTDAAQLDAALASAEAEARAAFGDGGLLLERALTDARHVEVQVFADAHGRVIHLGERDCSVQRRHQKLVEEAPSPAVDAALRRRLGDTAVAVAREVGYVGAGTVEFLLEADGSFWFMEMNTRLQVEHPVTESLVGVDLVEWQIAVARGEHLPLAQDEVLARFERGGHAIEVRLCAEDPAHGDLPQAGRLLLWEAPAGMRCDDALANGLDIPPFYDSMLAKVVARAPSRPAALAALGSALDRTVCLGVPTNRAFLAAVLRDPVFASGAATTAFLAGQVDAATLRERTVPTRLAALAAASHALLPNHDLPSHWAGWSSTGVVDTVAPLRIGSTVQAWRLRGTSAEVDGRCGEAVHRVAGLRRIDATTVAATVDGRPVTARTVRDGTRTLWLADGRELDVIDLRLGEAAVAADDTTGAVRAPMHGRISQVLVSAGATVEAGTLLVVLEAMKMEHQLRAPRAGTVAALHAQTGQQVGARALLVELQP